MIYYLSLGSNMGDREDHLRKAVSFLRSIGDIKKISSVYETTPVSMNHGYDNFYNIVICIEIKLIPDILLSKIKRFEESMGRNIEDSHNLPRKIDIDILMADDMVLNEKDLVIPHKEMVNRAFVLIPLNEIAPGLVHPVSSKTIRDLLKKLKTDETVIEIKDFYLCWTIFEC